MDLGQAIIIFDKWPVHVTVKSMSLMEQEDPYWYSWAVWIEADPLGFLRQIREVEYHLHSTFKEKDIIIQDRTHAFSLLSRGWGEFNIKLDVRLFDGSEVRLTHYLKLGRDKPDASPYMLQKGDFSKKRYGLGKIKKVIT